MNVSLWSRGCRNWLLFNEGIGVIDCGDCCIVAVSFPSSSANNKDFGRKSDRNGSGDLDCFEAVKASVTRGDSIEAA
eukprot:CAMPEP_0201136588 /NCGR_PEP_ID=MMETSP0850-20130426/54962_1 /ASSEMBLY_ACC=CAM_ASM_000622 /TAXON_ID=183588 /ORGANISM="Pseudo-nitzschia fraudulenta, Strain WWA7" /LENGTH=76 /DNA_ID=CAMNT_0047407897 /DNA_START=1706 /DNA_END=1933 /DNA_ORIENTATION=+